MSVVWLTALTALLTLAFLATLAVALIKLIPLLDAIGGKPVSTLARLRFGLRAIERETSHLPTQAARVNAQLGRVAEGLTAVDGHLQRTEAALLAQGEQR